MVRAGSRLFIYLLIFLNLFERVMGTNVPCRPNFRLGMSGSATSCHSYPHAQLNFCVVNPPLQEAKYIIKLRRRGGGSSLKPLWVGTGLILSTIQKLSVTLRARSSTITSPCIAFALEHTVRSLAPCSVQRWHRRLALLDTHDK